MAIIFRFGIKWVTTGPYAKPTSLGATCVVTDDELVIPGAEYPTTLLRDVEKLELEDASDQLFLTGVNVRGYYFCLFFDTQRERDAAVRALVKVTGAPAWKGWQRVY